MIEEAHRALRNAAVDEYIVREQRIQSLTRSIGQDQKTTRQTIHNLGASVFVDRELGRGHSELSMLPGADLTKLVSQSADRALGAIGPSWRLRPPSAPARLHLADSEWARSLDDSVDLLWEQFHSHQPPSLDLTSAQLSLELQDTRALVSNGFDNHYQSTKVKITAEVQAKKGAPVLMHLAARHPEGLRWQAVFEDAVQRSLRVPRAEANQSGQCDLLLLASAYYPVGDREFGIWNAPVHQCRAALARSGLARYQIGQETLQEPPRGDTLTLRSDGTRDFGWRSAPFDSDGQGVRRFTLIKDGKAAGQSIGYIDAARHGVAPNGGVRNLIIEPGELSLDELGTPGERPLILVRSLSDLHAAARGGVCLRIGDSEQRVRDSSGLTKTKTTHGGVLCGNLYRWLQDARFSSEQDDLPWLKGPSAIRFNQLELQA